MDLEPHERRVFKGVAAFIAVALVACMLGPLWWVAPVTAGLLIFSPRRGRKPLLTIVDEGVERNNTLLSAPAVGYDALDAELEHLLGLTPTKKSQRETQRYVPGSRWVVTIRRVKIGYLVRLEDGMLYYGPAIYLGINWWWAHSWDAALLKGHAKARKAAVR